MAANEIPPIGRAVSPARIFLTFLRLGLTAFGGPAMVAYVRAMAVAGKRWLSEDSFRDGVALCQSLPGATAMQIAAYCGFRASGFGGAAAAYVGFGLPAFLLMVALSAVYARAQDFDVAVSVFTGLRVMVVAIVANATLDFARTSLKSIRDGLLVLGAAVFMSLGGHPVVAIAAVIAIALLLYRDLIPTSVKEPPISCPAPTRTRNLLTAPLLLALSVAVIMTLLFLADRTLFSIAAVMTKIDLLAFGGGFVSIPLMFHEVVEARHWLDGKTFMDGIALGQVTPGPIVITATFVGYKVAGLPGAVVATVGIFTPSFVVLVAAVPYLDRLQQSALFRRALRGALVCFVGLLFAVTVRFALAAPWSIPSAIIAGLAFVALRFKVDILWVVLAAAAASTILL